MISFEADPDSDIGTPEYALNGKKRSFFFLYLFCLPYGVRDDDGGLGWSFSTVILRAAETVLRGYY